MVMMKNFNMILSQILAIASQKLVLRISLPNKRLHNNRDNIYDEIELIFS